MLFPLKSIMYYVLCIMGVLYIIHATNYIIPTAFAQTATQSSVVSRQSSDNQLTPSPLPLPPYVSPTSPLYTDLLVSNLFHSFSCLAIGQSVIGQPCLTYQMTKNAQGMMQSIPMLSSANLSGGVLGTTTSLIGALYANPPVRTIDYLASVGHGLGIVKTANAQVTGSGAGVLSPILALWQTSRNISYVIMIIIFLIIGLMVMFRNKINPQTIITAQAALPGLVIGLIMITFSFFFAGLISDMAFVGTNIVGYYFTAAQNKPPEDLAQKLSNSNILGIMGALTGIIKSGDISSFMSTVYDVLGSDAQRAIQTLVFWISAQFASNLVPGDLLATSEKLSPWALLIKPIIGVIVGVGTNFALASLLGLFLSMAAALALVYQMFKLFFKLLMAWLTIIFLTISAPFQFLFASLPGRQGIATSWMLSMLGNILIFPAVIAVIYFVAFLLGPKFTAHCPKDAGKCLIKVSSSNQINNGGFISPVYAAGTEIVGPDTFPLFGGMNLDFVKILLAFGALMALPTIPDIIVRTVGKAGQTGQMIGQEITGGTRFGQGYSQKSYQSGVALGQQGFTGLTGETQVDPYGNLQVTRGGILRQVPGKVNVPIVANNPSRVGKYFWQK